MNEHDEREKLVYSLKIPPEQRSQPSVAWTRRRKVLGVLALLLVLALFFAIRGFFGVPKVEVARAEIIQAGLPEISLTAGGYVVADSTILVSSQINGRVKSVLVEEGDKVKEGQVLAEIENNDYLAKYLSSKAEFELAAATLKRKSALYKEGVLSRNEYDETVRAFGVAKAAMESQKYFLDQTQVRSPIDGTVIKKEKEAGEYLLPGITSEGVPGSAVIKVADLRVMNVEMDILESDLPKVKMDQPAMVFPDALPDRSYTAKLNYISPQADRQKSIVQIKVRIDKPDDQLKPEMSARVYLLKSAPTQEVQRRILVPASSIVEKDGKKFVFVVKQDRLTELPVEVAGEPAEGKVAVRSGLDGDESVLVTPRRSFRTGQKVEVKQGS